MTHTLIYPHTTTHNAAGHLEIGGCDVVELADSFGTPLFIYDEQSLRDQCRAYHKAFGALTDRYEIVYASKAFSCRAMCELVAQENLSLDVATGGELAAAVAAGFPMHRVYFHGNNKSMAEIEAGLDSDIGHFVIDSFEEIERLETAAAARGRARDVLVRVTPGVRPNTHDFVQTGQQDSKFGLGLADGRADEAVRRIHDCAHLRLIGVHAHIGSQIFELDSYRREVEVLFVAIDNWRRDFGFACQVVNIGGGLGIRYTSADMPSSIAEFAEVSVNALHDGAVRHGMEVPKLLVEPGRSIVGKAAVTAYTVGTVKVIPGVRTYVAVDGGMSDNLRPMLYGSRYEAMIANKAEVAATDVVTIAGKHCESGDVLVRDVHIAPPAPGDILVTPSTGAYGYAMANNYNAQPRPAVIMVRDGEARVIIERETWEDLLRLQRPLT
ncbi:MAG: diaminopimelate decarboxylase [Thermoleophilia bacterium]